MPSIRWDWKSVPAFLLAIAQLIVLILVVGAWTGRSAVTQETAANSIQRLDTMVSQSLKSQAAVTERLVKVETKVDLIFPKLDRIEAKVNGEPPPVQLYGPRRD
jgi:peptidoglycan hydrolase CwlO-like protein